MIDLTQLQHHTKASIPWLFPMAGVVLVTDKDNETFRLPLLGFTLAAASDHDPKRPEVALEPVVLPVESGGPATLHDLLCTHQCGESPEFEYRQHYTVQILPNGTGADDHGLA